MNKILCGGIILLLTSITFLSASFATSDIQNQALPFQSFLEETQVTPPVNNSVSLASQVADEISVTATLPDYPWVRVSEYRGYLIEKCVLCHKGISQVSGSHPLSFGCTVCHGT